MMKNKSTLAICILLLLILVTQLYISNQLTLQHNSQSAQLNSAVGVVNQRLQDVYSEIANIQLTENSFSSRNNEISFTHPDFFQVSECDETRLNADPVNGWKKISVIEFAKEKCVNESNGGKFGAIKIYALDNSERDKIFSNNRVSYLQNRFSRDGSVIKVNERMFGEKVAYLVERNQINGSSEIGGFFGLPEEDYYFIWGNFIINASIDYSEHFGRDKVEDSLEAFFHILSIMKIDL